MSLKNSDAKLRALGGSLPPDTLDKNASLPVSGNLLEIANWRPPASSVRYKTHCMHYITCVV